MAGDVGGEDHYPGGGGSGVGHAAEPEHAEPQVEVESEQDEGQELPGRRAGKPYTGQHRQQPPTPVDRWQDRRHDAGRRKLEGAGPPSTAARPAITHSGNQRPGLDTDKRQVFRPGRTGNMGANPDHPLMANYGHIIAALQEPK